MEEIMIVLIVFSTIAFVIYQFLNHRQRMRMIDKGVTKLEISHARKSRSHNSMKIGVIAIALGLAIFIAQIFEHLMRTRIGGEIGLALVPLFIGIALVIFAFLDKNKNGTNSESSDFVEMKGSESA